MTMRLKRSLLVSAELSVHAEQGNSDVGANPTVAPNVAPFQPESKLEAIRQEEKAINDTQPTNQAPAANRIAADPVHKRHHRPVHHQAAHQARPAHQPHAVRHPVHPAYFRQPSIRRFLIYGRPHNRPDLPLVLIYPRPSTNYSRNTLAMFRAISESPNKPILGLNIIPFLGMNLISEVLGLDLTLIPEHRDDLDQVEDDSIHFPSDMNREQLLRLMEQHGMVPMPKDDDEDSSEIQTKRDRLVLMGQQAAPEYRPPAPNGLNRGMLQLMSNYNRREVEDETVPHIQPRSLGIFPKFHPRFNIKNEGELEISEANRKRRSADSDKEDTTTSTSATTESSESKHSNHSNEESSSEHSDSSEESKHSESSDNNNSTTESSNSNNSTTTADEAHKTVSQILEQLLIEVIEFLFH